MHLRHEDPFPSLHRGSTETLPTLRSLGTFAAFPSTSSRPEEPFAFPPPLLPGLSNSRWLPKDDGRRFLASRSLDGSEGVEDVPWMHRNAQDDVIRLNVPWVALVFMGSMLRLPGLEVGCSDVAVSSKICTSLPRTLGGVTDEAFRHEPTPWPWLWLEDVSAILLARCPCSQVLGLLSSPIPKTWNTLNLPMPSHQTFISSLDKIKDESLSFSGPSPWHAHSYP